MATYAQMDPGSDEQELQYHNHTYSQHGQPESPQSKSPLQGFGGLFKGISSGSEKKLKADGQLPKRRGPKPDSKPAMTRRQELNRQAQRTHRERKEMYIKALEQEVLRLKETYQACAKERDAYRVENEQLRALLKQYGIPCPPPGVASPDPAAAGRPPFGMSSSGSFSGSYPPPSSEGHPSRSPPVRGGIGGPSPVHGQRQGPGMGNLTAMLPGEQGMDYATVGVDFVTTYGRQAPYPSPPPHQ